MAPPCRTHGHHRAKPVTATGQVSCPPLGRTQWPLTLGAMGMFVGPQVHVIDPCGLTDRFMASLSYTPTGQWKAGHFERPLPDGYLEAVKYRDATRVRDPALAAELQKLWQVIGR